MKFENDNPNLDIKKAKTAIDSFCKITGVNAVLLDLRGNILYNYADSNVKCNFCQEFPFTGLEHQGCIKTSLYGSYQAERFGGKYMFFCPMGFTHFASPILYDEFMISSIVAGPILLVDQDEFWEVDIAGKMDIPADMVDDVKEFIKKVPQVSPEMASALSEQLFLNAWYLSGGNNERFLDNAQSEEQQSSISKYIHYIKSLDVDTHEKTYPLDKERDLLSAISSGDKNSSRELLNEILGHILFKSSGDFKVIKARALELVVLLSRAALEGGADPELIFGMNYKYLDEIHQFKNIEELTLWLSKIMVRFTDCVFSFNDVKHVDVIYKSIDYIKRHYTEKVTLEDVARNVYLSPSYFSKIFKDEMKCNFNVYLNQVRIENSKKLLLHDNISLVEISNMVGFEDQSYYSKVFKKITGITPGKYRETRGGRIN